MAAVLAILAFALLMASSRMARHDSDIDIVLYYCIRLTQVFTYFGLALAFRNTLPSVKRLLTVAISACGTFLFLTVCIGCGVISDAFVSPLNAFSEVLLGVGNATGIIVSLHLLSTYAPRYSAPALIGASVIMEILYCLSSMLPGVSFVFVRSVFLAAGIAALLVSSRIKLKSSVTPNEHPLQYGISYSTGTSDRPLAFLVNGADWVFQMIIAVLIPTIYGFLSQLFSAGSSGSMLFGQLSEGAVVAALLVLLVIALVFKPHFAFTTMFIPVILMYATGLALLPLLWESGNLLAGILISCGLNIYKTLLSVLLAEKAYGDPRHTYLFFGVFYGYANALYGRMLEPIVIGSAGVDFSLVVTISIIFLWSLVNICLLLFVLQKTFPKRFRAAVGALEEPASSDEEGLLADGATSPERQEANTDPFLIGIEALTKEAQLSPREKEVLILALHGYTMAGAAEELCISTETVRTHMKRIYSKAGVSNKQALVKKITSFGSN